jgi:hypothetical protein
MNSYAKIQHLLLALTLQAGLAIPMHGAAVVLQAQPAPAVLSLEERIKICMRWNVQLIGLNGFKEIAQKRPDKTLPCLLFNGDHIATINANNETIATHFPASGMQPARSIVLTYQQFDDMQRNPKIIFIQRCFRVAQ